MAQVRWERGGDAVLVTLIGDAIVMRSSIPSPPGSRLRGPLSVASAELHMKVHSSKRQSDGTFLLEGRLIDATRELRARLLASVDASPIADTTSDAAVSDG